jgi:hypothetical protein
VARPDRFNGHPVLPLEGKRLLTTFEGKRREWHEYIFWEYSACCAGG